MRKNNICGLLLAIAAFSSFLLSSGCMKVVKEEEIISGGETAAPVEAPQAGNEDAQAVINEEKIVEQTVTEQPIEEVPAPAASAEEKKELSAKTEAGGEIAELARKKGALLTVYFDFDRFTIRDDMKSALEKNEEWLKKNPGAKIQIQGHGDERGTNEYNIALGERRAQSIKEYLVDYGIDPARLSTISYGEERPAEPGHNEEAWAKNRRGEFVIIKNKNTVSVDRGAQ